jgi:hypothetical protein
MVNLEKLRDISQQDLALLGADDLAYVRQIALEDETVFAVTAADGRQIAFADDFEAAILAAHEHSYYTVSVH